VIFLSVLAGFAVVCIEATVAFYKKVHAINFGIYGATMVGKTTLHHQLRTRGEVPEIRERTVGKQRASRKTIKLDGDTHTLKTADMGGEAIYWREWMQDMKNRKVKYVIFVIDHRHLDSTANLDHQLAWKFLVDAICSASWPNGKKKKNTDYPLAVGIWANKYDIWGDKYKEDVDISNHSIFTPFKYGMQQLNDKGIPTYKYIVSAKSQPEMVYKGVTTMIKDY
jgi:GTPase SAR1 family protein